MIDPVIVDQSRWGEFLILNFQFEPVVNSLIPRFQCYVYPGLTTQHYLNMKYCARYALINWQNMSFSINFLSPPRVSVRDAQQEENMPINQWKINIFWCKKWDKCSCSAPGWVLLSIQMMFRWSNLNMLRMINHRLERGKLENRNMLPWKSKTVWINFISFVKNIFHKIFEQTFS